MPGTRVEWAVCLALVAAGGVLVGLSAWTWWSDYRITPRAEAAPTTAEHVPAPKRAAHVAFTPPARPRAVRVAIAATRGECWLSIRRGSADGAVVTERVLAQGETLRVAGRRLWIRLGAAANVDVTVDGTSRRVPAGTSNFVATAS